MKAAKTSSFAALFSPVGRRKASACSRQASVLGPGTRRVEVEEPQWRCPYRPGKRCPPSPVDTLISMNPAATAGGVRVRGRE